jgi:dethiobiotin synthetase
MSSGLFITGTGTGVGKTYVGALIAKALRNGGKQVGVYKPVASGCEASGGKLFSPDAAALWDAAGRPGALEQVCPQLFAAPLAPHLAARAEGRTVDTELLRDGIDFWLTTSDVVIVEGAGGLMSPISDEDYNADLAAEFGFPLLVVSANELGTINHTLLTLMAAASYSDDGLSTAGIVLNSPRPTAGDPSVESNADQLALHCGAPLLTTVTHGGGFERAVDWWSLAGSATRPHVD